MSEEPAGPVEPDEFVEMYRAERLYPKIQSLANKRDSSERNKAIWTFSQEMYATHKAVKKREIEPFKEKIRELEKALRDAEKAVKAAEADNKSLKNKVEEGIILTDEERAEHVARLLDGKLIAKELTAQELAQFKDIFGLKAKDRDITINVIVFGNEAYKQYSGNPA